MNINDIFGQYNSRGVTTPINPTQQSAVASLSNTLKQLTQGLIFEGNVTRVRGDNVLLSLENGQSIKARLDTNLKLVQGQSMFFQVKENDGHTVAIRPYGGDGLSNPTLMQALKAAGLPIEGRNLDMVNAMMKEHMAIDADSLLSMHKSLATSPNVSVDTIVQMTRLGMEITPDQAGQFENYKSDTNLITTQLMDMADEATALLVGENVTVDEALSMQTELLTIIEAGMPDEEIIMPDVYIGMEMDEELMTDSDVASPKNDIQASDPQSRPLALPEPEIDNSIIKDSVNISTANDPKPSLFSAQVGLADDFDDELGYEVRKGSIESFMSSEEMEDLADVLRSVGTLADREEIFDSDGDLNRNLTSKQLLNYINNEMVLSKDILEPEDVREVFSSKGYKKLLNNLIDRAWTVEPEELKSPDKMKELYSRLNAQIDELNKTLKATGHENSQLANTTNDIKSNIEFMEQVNQIYQYIQIPFNANGKNTSADLYVYTNKKAGQSPDGELSAFLHLDMDNLGSTDCMVKMKGKAVSTNFTFEDDKSFELVQQYLPILQQKLDALGYNSTVTVGIADEEAPKMNFVENFLKKDLPSGSGVVHRYSFDVRA